MVPKKIAKMKQKRFERLSKRVITPLPYQDKSSGSSYLWMLLLLFLTRRINWLNNIKPQIDK